MIRAIKRLKECFGKTKARPAFFSLSRAEVNMIKREAQKWPQSPGRAAAMGLSYSPDVLHDECVAEMIVAAAECYDIQQDIEERLPQIMPHLVAMARLSRK